MSQSLVRNLVHLVFSTKHRQLWLSDDVRDSLFVGLTQIVLPFQGDERRTVFPGQSDCQWQRTVTSPWVLVNSGIVGRANDVDSKRRLFEAEKSRTFFARGGISRHRSLFPGHDPHAYYDQYQYLPRVITCAENDLVVDLCLLYGSAHPALGAAQDVEYVVGRWRQAWPGVQIHLRGDSGFGVPKVYKACEQLDVYYTVGIGINPRLKNLTEPLLNEAVASFEASGEPQRLVTAFWYRADSWPAQRWVVVKCEANSQGTNRRAVVTNRPGAFVLPDAA